MRSTSKRQEFELGCLRESVRGEIGRPIDGAALWALAESPHGVTPAVARNAYEFLCEAVSNVYSHAYPHAAHCSAWLGWEASARMDTSAGQVVFAVRDQGIGIPASITELSETKNLGPVELVRRAATSQEAPADGPWRGRGLSGMVDLVSRRERCRLDIQSAGQLVSFSRAFPGGKARQTDQGLVGTVMSLTMPLDPEDGPVRG